MKWDLIRLLLYIFQGNKSHLLLGWNRMQGLGWEHLVFFCLSRGEWRDNLKIPARLSNRSSTTLSRDKDSSCNGYCMSGGGPGSQSPALQSCCRVCISTESRQEFSSTLITSIWDPPCELFHNSWTNSFSGCLFLPGTRGCIFASQMGCCGIKQTLQTYLQT